MILMSLVSLVLTQLNLTYNTHSKDILSFIHVVHLDGDFFVCFPVFFSFNARLLRWASFCFDSLFSYGKRYYICCAKIWSLVSIAIDSGLFVIEKVNFIIYS